MGNIFSKSRRKKVEITPAPTETVTEAPAEPDPREHQTVARELDQVTQDIEDEATRIMEERRARRRNEAKQRLKEQQQGSEDLT